MVDIFIYFSNLSFGQLAKELPNTYNHPDGMLVWRL